MLLFRQAKCFVVCVAIYDRKSTRLTWPKMLNFALVFVLFHVYLYRHGFMRFRGVLELTLV